VDEYDKFILQGGFKMNMPRYFGRALLALAGVALVMGIELIAQDEAGQNRQFVSKSLKEQSKDFLRGPRGHRGHRGARGHRGHPGAFVIGSAYGWDGNTATLNGEQVTLRSSPTPNGFQLAPLYYANISSGNPFTFQPYNPLGPSGASFTINQAGTYLLQYGLIGAPSPALVQDLLYPPFNTSQNGWQNTMPIPGAPISTSVSCWICIQIVDPSTSTTSQIGAIPLCLTWTGAPAASYPNWILSGFGQISTQLPQGAAVTLQIVVNDSNSSASITIDPAMLPGQSSASLARGPTLTITKISD
jgi:hypothetical protein